MMESQAKIILARSFSKEYKTSFIHPVFGLWSVSLKRHLTDSLDKGTRKVLDWVYCHSMEYVTFQDEGIDPFFNINKNEDLEFLKKQRNIDL